MKQKRIDATQGKWIKIVGIVAACGILLVLAYDAFSATQRRTDELQREAHHANQARDDALEEIRILNAELDKISVRFAKAREDLVEFKLRSATNRILASELMEDRGSPDPYTPLIMAAAEYCIREESLLLQAYLNGESEDFSNDQLSRYQEYSRYLRGGSSGTNPVSDYCLSDISSSLTKVAQEQGIESGERVNQRIQDLVVTMCFALDVQVYDDFDDWSLRYFTSQQIERYEAYNSVKDTDEDAHPSAEYCIDMVDSLKSEAISELRGRIED